MASQPQPEAGMDDSELASLLAAHESRAVGYYNSEIAEQQAKALNYYYGRMDDLPALDGCSSVVDYTVAVQVDNALAAVLKPFVSADDVVKFEPRGPEDVAQAEQATEYVNYVINCDNPGFQILHDWFKDALLSKLGIVKVWWEDTSKSSVHQVAVDAIGLEQARQAESYLGEQDNGDGTFAVAIEKVDPDGRVRVENIPPEEFLISPFARSVDEAPYVAHRPTNMTRSDLIEMGMDAEVVDGLPAFAQGQNDESRAQARYRDEEWFSGSREAIGNDKSRDVIAVLDEYVRVDYDGDGLSELRRVIRVDDTILFNEPVDKAPFATLCPVPMPHKVYGLALADQAMEGQKVSTAVTRQTLDNLYKSNNPRPVIGQNALLDCTIEDIGDSSPGAGIRVKDATQLAWNVVPYTAHQSFPMLEYVQQQTEERTGIQRKGQGFNAEALKKNSPDTATQAAIDENSRNERAEMIARIFAETGVKRLFKLVLGLLVQHQPKERVIRLRNQWVPIDPRGWSAEMDLSISVGLGIGNKAQQIEQAQVVLELYERLIQTPYAYLVTPENVHSAAARLFTASGIKNVDDFLADPKQVQAPPPKPDPKMAEAQAKIQIEQVKAQSKAQVDQANLQLKAFVEQAKMALAQSTAQQQAALDQAKANFEAQLAIAESRAELQLERERLAMQREVNAARADNDREKIKANRPGGKLNK